MNHNYNEMDLSQKPALEVLEKMGYVLLKPEEAEVMRKCCHSPGCFKETNEDKCFEYRKKNYFSEKNIEAT